MSEASMNKNKITIIVVGGVISGVYSDEIKAQVEVIDADCLSKSEFERRVEKSREKCKIELY